ncbi:sortilin-related receptor-like, partial [Vanessa cardui]|uniref:sortilin-related receptor-like n=1 Tax=Vanessa cardui TaxID=171605 RepID=UPI001F13C093
FDRAPIKNLNFAYNAKKELHIFWNANCDVIREPIAYRLDITELTRNRVSRYELRASENVSLAHVVHDVPLGARFNICVYASEKGAAQTCAPVRAGEVEPPRAVMAWLSPNGHIMVSWQHPDDNSSVRKHKYQILVSQKEIPEDILHPTEDIRTAEAEFSPLIMSADSTTTGPLFVSVRAVTQDGYYSDLSEVLSMEGSEVAEASPWRAGAAWWGAGVACVCALALGAALLHAALRHRRLSHSLLRLAATPRYDSRRGQATIDHDDDDVPPIHGFSDDEPLVIA